MAKLKGFILAVLVLCYTMQLVVSQARDDSEETRAKEQEWRRREKTAEEEQERQHRRSSDEERRAKEQEWRRREKAAEEERRRRQQEEDEDQDEDGREEPPPYPYGPSGGGEGKEMFMLRESKEVVRTKAGEMRVVTGFGGRWNVERPLHIGFITMEPRSLFVPQYLDSSLIIFVRRGKAKIGLIYEDEFGERPLRMGDVYRVPAGSTFYIVNTGDTERLHIICSIDNSEGFGLGHGPFQSFFIGGGTYPVSVLSGFDPRTLSNAFNVSIGRLSKILTGQKAGPIVFADTTNATDAPILWANFLKLKEEDRLGHLNMVASRAGDGPKEEGEETKWSWRNILASFLGSENKKKEEKGDAKKTGSAPDACNLLDRDPSFSNKYGWSIALDKHDYSPLKKSGVGLYYVNLTAGSMMAPHVNPTATEYGVVLKGSGTIQVVLPNGTSGMNTEVNEGDVFLIPRYFPFCQIASRNGPFEFFGFTTSARRNHPQFLVGSSSILKTLRGPEMATALGLPEDTYDDLVDAQGEILILPSPSAAPPNKGIEAKIEKQNTKMIEEVPNFIRGLGKEMMMD